MARRRPFRIAALALAGLVAGAGCDVVDPAPADRLTIAQGTTAPLSTDTDVAYGPAPRQVLDVHLPRRSRPGLRPAVVYFHAGGWTTGDKTDLSHLARAQLAQGWVVISVNYRLTPDHRFPAQVHDAKRAVRFVKANAARWRIDPDRLVAWGTSAGGHLAAMVGLTADDPAFTPPGLPAELAGVSDRVAGFVVMAGITDLGAWLGHDHWWPAWLTGWLLPCGTGLREVGGCSAAQLAEASPVTYADAGDPPGYLLYGARDPVVPVDQGRRLYDALTGAKGMFGALFDLVDTGDAWHQGHLVDFGANRAVLQLWLRQVAGA